MARRAGPGGKQHRRNICIDELTREILEDMVIDEDLPDVTSVSAAIRHLARKRGFIALGEALAKGMRKKP